MSEQKFEVLKERLLETKTWPIRYMFKFIVPNKDNKVDVVKDLMPKHGKISFKHTKSLTFVSVTCIASMKSYDAIIDIVEKVSKIDVVMTL